MKENREHEGQPWELILRDEKACNYMSIIITKPINVTNSSRQLHLWERENREWVTLTYEEVVLHY